MRILGQAHPTVGADALLRACLIVLTLAAILAAATPTHATTSATIIYVVPGGTGGGASWADGKDLAAALSGAASGSELWVKAGTYKPTTTGDRDATFALKSGVALYGGFAGTETTRDGRDGRVNVTTLSGDIGTPNDNSDNSYHVVTGSGTDNTAILDGFTVSGGAATNTASPFVCPNNCGGGMYNNAGSPSVRHVVFSNNSAHGAGGGVANVGGSSPTLTDVFVAGNVNTSGEGGGGMYNYWSNPTLTNVTFSGNSSPHGYGGGMMNSNSNPTLTNVTFTGNTTRDGAGAMYNLGSNPKIRNSILWGDSASEIDGHGSTPVVSYSIVQQASGVYLGVGNLNADPKFISPITAPAPTTTGNLRLQAISPAINAGDNNVTNPALPTTDLDGNPRILGGTVDMGAYEYPPYSVGYVSPLLAAPSVNDLYPTSIGLTRTPIRWKLTNAAGAPFTAAGTVTKIAYKLNPSCSSFNEDPGGATAASLDSANPRYDTMQKAWIYNWQLPGRGCYSLFVTLNSAQTLTLRYNIH
ncbi:MAG: choice-of-anchor Q domain-containing protein [Anaerolineae bacterium]